jgi:hypothetical protein
VQFQNTTVSNLPTHGIGVGSSYYANTAYSTQNGAFVRNAWLEWKRPFDVAGLSVKGGRQLYSDAMDAPAKDPTLLWVQSNRIGRLLAIPITPMRVAASTAGSLDAESWNVTAFGFRPTRGGFRGARQWRDGHRGWRAPRSTWKDSPAVAAFAGQDHRQILILYYGDDRDVPFLTPAARACAGRRRGDANLHTVGATRARRAARSRKPGCDGPASPVRRGRQYHAPTPGVRSSAISSRGAGEASGCASASTRDRATLIRPTHTHETFFQMLPTAWLLRAVPVLQHDERPGRLRAALCCNRIRACRCAGTYPLAARSSSRDLTYRWRARRAIPSSATATRYTEGWRDNDVALLTHPMLSVKPIDPLTVNVSTRTLSQSVIRANYGGKSANSDSWR